MTKHFGAVAGEVKLGSQFLKKIIKTRKFQGRKIDNLSKYALLLRLV